MKTIFFRALVVMLLTVGVGPRLFSQVYLVYFEEKSPCGETTLDFHPKALERRARLGIPFPQALDCPVNQGLIDRIRPLVDSVRHPLRWFNAVSVAAGPLAIQQVLAVPGVSHVELLTSWPEPVCAEEGPAVAAEPQKLDSLFALQQQLMGMDQRPAELDGRGVRIAVLDAGFAGVDDHPAFARLHKRGGIVGTRDFYSNRKTVYRHSTHGTAVLSCIAGEYQGKCIGAAPGADFLLARTESGLFEKPREEDSWLAAMEWADQMGADLISSSLGYGVKRYTYADMDGRRAPVSRAAATAVRLGILVVNSAGNSGNKNFHYITAPGDVDSVLTVGASYPMLRYPMPFSSYGPNARGVAKPDIAAPGYVVGAHRKGDYRVFPGTSFACPLIAGYAACLLQAHPDSSNMAIHRMVREAGHLYPYFDYQLGHGVPGFADWGQPRQPTEATFEVFERNDSVFFVFHPEHILRDTTAQNGRPFHVSFIQEDGRLSRFYSFRIPPNAQAYALPERSPGRLRAWYQGYLYEENE